MNVKAVIFDLDGTIIGSEKLQSNAYEMVLKEYGKKPILNSVGVAHIPGVRAKDVWPLLKKQYNITEDVKILTDKKRAYFFKILKESNIKPNSGFFKLFKLLQKENIKMCIATGSPLRHIQLITKRFKINNSFEAYVSGEDVSHGKPHPEIYQKALQKLGISPEYVVALEDSGPGVESARTAGIKVIAIPTKYTANDNFSQADLIVKSLNDINLKVLENL